MTKSKMPGVSAPGNDIQLGTKLSDNIVQRLGGELRVCSETIAERTENQHKNVLQLIRAYRQDLEEFGGVESQTRPFGTAGGTQQREVFYLNEPQATLILAYMRNMDRIRQFKKELVAQFYEMRAALMAPVPALSEDEVIHQALQITSRKIKELEAKAAEDAPKVGYVDTFVADGDLLLLRTVAKSLGMQEKDLRNQLESRGWIYKDTASRWSASINQKVYTHRYSAFSHKTAYFTPVPNHEAPRFRGEVMHTLKVTPLGAEAIARNFKQVAA